jgi:hypothetical protein
MYKRYRWYRVQLPKNSVSLRDAIFQNLLRPENDFGFSVSEKVGEPLPFRFLWRTKITVTKYDETGMLSYEDVTSVSFTDFAVIEVDNHIFLRIENPSRSLKDMFNTLESIYGLGFTSRRIDFEKTKPKRIFESIPTGVLTKLKVVGAVFDEGLVGRLELESTTGILTEHLSMLKNIPYKIDTASYELVYGGVRGNFTFSANGSVKLDGALALRMLQLIEQDLPLFV